MHATAAPTGVAAPSSHHNLPVFLHFALSLLHSALKHHKLHESDAAIRALLDPYLPLLASTTLLMQPGKGRAAATSVEVVEVSLKVCNFLLRWPSLPSHGAFVGPLASFLFSLLQQGDAALHPPLFKTLSILIHHCRHAFNAAQLSLLFSFIKEAVLTPTERSPVFPLLHAVLTRKWLHPDLYDVMDRVATLLVTSPSAAVRDEAAALFLLFLLDYPLGRQAHATAPDVPGAEPRLRRGGRPPGGGGHAGVGGGAPSRRWRWTRRRSCCGSPSSWR